MKTLLFIILFGLFASSCLVIESPEPEPTGPESVEDNRLQCRSLLVPCGCNGPVGPGAVFQESDCQSGLAEAIPCTARGPYCAGVTYPWLLQCAC